MVIINLVVAWFIFQRTEPVPGLLRPFADDLWTARLALIVLSGVIFLVGCLSYTFLEKPARTWLKEKLTDGKTGQ